MLPLYDENRSRTTPIVTWALIAANIIVFVWEITYNFDQWIFFTFGEVPYLVFRGENLYTLITSMFLHADFWHILGNMLYLFVFGDNIEDRFGHVKYLFFYLIFGIVGGLAHAFISVTEGGVGACIPTIGASGAVSGILGAYIVLFPRARVVSVVPSFFFLRLARIPAIVFIGFWFIVQLLYAGSMRGVAYMAHIGGFVTGLIMATLFRVLNREKRTRWY